MSLRGVDSGSPVEIKSGSAGGESEWVLLAVIVRPHGRHGEVLAERETDFPELFSQRRELFLSPPAPAAKAPQPVSLASWRMHGERLLLCFEQVGSMEAAEDLRGWEVLLPASQRAPLDDNSVYYADVVGCRLFDQTSAQFAGTIVGVDRESANLDLFVVAPDSDPSAELLVPFAAAYQPTFDLPNRRVDMHLPEGLLTIEAGAEPPESATRRSPRRRPRPAGKR